MLLKVNHIINLHDARYVAAEGIFAMTLCADRKHHHNLPEAMIAEFITWITGISVILDINEDYDQAFLAEKYHLGLQTRFSSQTSFPSYQPRIYSCAVAELEILPEIPENHYYEVQLPATFSEDYIPKLNQAIEKHRIIIQADFLPEKYLQQLKPAGWSWRDHLKYSDGILNYDEFERLKAAINP